MNLKSLQRRLDQVRDELMPAKSRTFVIGHDGTLPDDYNPGTDLVQMHVVEKPEVQHIEPMLNWKGNKYAPDQLSQLAGRNNQPRVHIYRTVYEAKPEGVI